jgi:hypothetical protein
MTITSVQIGHKHVKMYWYVERPDLKVRVVFNVLTREWACGKMTGKKPLDLARKALNERASQR